MSKHTTADLNVLPYWRAEAKSILRAELQRRSVTYAKLAKLMQANAIHETERSLATKISRGTFSFVFFLQVMRVLKVTHLSLAPTEAVASVLYSGQPVQMEKGRGLGVGEEK